MEVFWYLRRGVLLDSVFCFRLQEKHYNEYFLLHFVQII